jgi:carboxymethylenebutenolidase
MDSIKLVSFSEETGLSINMSCLFLGLNRGSLVKNIKAALCIHYAEMDERVNAGKDAYENALKEAGILYEQYVYAGAQHAFHNDTAPTRYNEAAAKLAWQRSIDFFKKYLG